MRRFALLLVLASLALPALAFDKVTVDQLQQAVAAAQGKRDKEVAEQLAGLELTERLSTARYERLKAGLPGDQSRLALLALADASAFLDLPAAEVTRVAAPDSATQGRIVSLAADFVVATVPRMPNFFATRTTTRFQDMKVSQLMTANSGETTIYMPNQGFHFVDRIISIVSYRNGREVVEAPGAKKPGSSVSYSTGLASWGVFGPLLGVVMTDVLRGKIGWGHWEQGPTGTLAVFRYAVAEDRSNFTVRFCCFRSDNGEMREYEAVPAYHGEIAIDPASGAVLRLVLKTDPQPTLLQGLPMERADVLVEYGPVEIGGRTYICPVESISISKADALVFHGNTFYVDKKGNPDDWVGNKKKHTETVSEPKVTAINDVVFENYHEFRGDVRILPEDSAEQNGDAPASAPATAPETHPKQ